MRWIPARLRATRSRYQRGGEQHGEDTSAAESKSSARTRAVIRGVAAALIRRSKLPLGIGAQRILRGPSPWVGYRVEPVSTGGAPEPHAVFVCPVDLQIPFLDELPQALRPTSLSEQAYEGACGRWSGTSFGYWGSQFAYYRNSGWHDSLQATGGVRRVVGRLGKGGHGLERRVVWQGISSGQPTRRYFRGDGGGSTAQD